MDYARTMLKTRSGTVAIALSYAPDAGAVLLAEGERLLVRQTPGRSPQRTALLHRNGLVRTNRRPHRLLLESVLLSLLEQLPLRPL
jgi:hypothetical protein